MRFTKNLGALAASIVVASVSFASDLSPTTQQTWTLRALVTELEENHYVDRRYNDAMSAAHLETYLERLDPSHLYFTASDVAEFERYSTRLDDLGRQGELSPPLRYLSVMNSARRNGSNMSFRIWTYRRRPGL